ncbi:hypothetical protein, unknown function [Leishmania tarentolae]|uniref:C2H2-type domain-containing protein n=1 Tax=Leishmania tarentolae TaxID=5689 RepID=A0A640KHZ6_LEITA|nr:hypothetical protein, unknown function [Leishmania tarentolae]
MPQAGDDERTHTIRPARHVLPDSLFILLVGEGNLSFAYALVKRLSRSAAVRRATQKDPVVAERRRGILVEVTATTFDSKAELSRKYPEAVGFLAYFTTKQRVHVRYYGDVNATALASATAPLGEHPWHLLIFNNPHIGFEDLYRHIALLAHFFHSARELHTRTPTMDFPQEIVVTLCDNQAQHWDLLRCAARSGYICFAALPLRLHDFPEYTNRRHQSDATFPFRIMVQFYFVTPEAALDGVLRDLYTEMMLWEEDRQLRLRQGLACSYTCEEWLRVAESKLPCSSHTISAKAETNHSPGTSPYFSSGDDFAVNRSAIFAEQPLPLLHPTLVARVVGEAAMARFSSDSPAHHTEAFMPYLPSSTWVTLYRAQRLAERQSCPPGALSRAAKERLLPPHLDSVVLGRALTSKEAKKLERYLSGYGAAMNAKTHQRAEADSEMAGAWSCKECACARTFETEEDLRQHEMAKHCGAFPLAPTLYARVHAQLESSADPMGETARNLDLFHDVNRACCDVCGLRFKTVDAYEEHLRYLSPLPGDDAEDLLCHACQPARTFTDRRALEQHRAMKHALPE